MFVLLDKLKFPTKSEETKEDDEFDDWGEDENSNDDKFYDLWDIRNKLMNKILR